MAQRRSLAWTELRVGILVISSFALLALAIFFITGESGFLTPKYTVKAYFQNANNLKAGADVQLEGVTVGNRGRRPGVEASRPGKSCGGHTASWIKNTRTSFAATPR